MSFSYCSVLPELDDDFNIGIRKDKKKHKNYSKLRLRKNNQSIPQFMETSLVQKSGNFYLLPG